MFALPLAKFHRRYCRIAFLSMTWLKLPLDLIRLLAPVAGMVSHFTGDLERGAGTHRAAHKPVSGL